MKAFKLICFPQQKVYLSIHRFFKISQWILILRRKWCNLRFYHLLQKSSLLLNTSVVPQEQKNFSYNLSRSIVSLDFKQENVLFFHSKSSELSTGIIYSYPQSPDTVTFNYLFLFRVWLGAEGLCGEGLPVLFTRISRNISTGITLVNQNIPLFLYPGIFPQELL